MNRDDAEQQSPSSPQVYRRQISREDAPAADVFARLGAGVQDPVPGGLIREYSGKVSSKSYFQYRFVSARLYLIFALFFLNTDKTKQSIELYSCR